MSELAIGLWLMFGSATIAGTVFGFRFEYSLLSGVNPFSPSPFLWLLGFWFLVGNLMLAHLDVVNSGHPFWYFTGFAILSILAAVCTIVVTAFVWELIFNIKVVRKYFWLFIAG